MAQSGSFSIVPVMHISSGRVIRWQGGQPAQYVGSLSNPLAMALHWARQGIRQLHVVDLDAAYGRMSVIPALLMAMKNQPIAISVGGGIRDKQTADSLVGYGASRIVSGTMLHQPSALRQIAQSVGYERVWGSVDVQEGRLVSAQTVDAVAYQAHYAGVGTLLLTAQAPATMAQADNLHVVRQFQDRGFHVWTAGQIDSLQDILTMYRAGVQGVLIGRALHEGALSYWALAGEVQRVSAHITA